MYLTLKHFDVSSLHLNHSYTNNCSEFQHCRQYFSPSIYVWPPLLPEVECGLFKETIQNKGSIIAPYSVLLFTKSLRYCLKVIQIRLILPSRSFIILIIVYSLHKEGRKRKEEKIKKHFEYNTLELNGTACYFRIIIRNVRGSADNIHIATTCNQRKYYAAQDHTYDARLRLLSSFHNADT